MLLQQNVELAHKVEILESERDTYRSKCEALETEKHAMWLESIKEEAKL
jgi:hypothetical protein